ncbi:hypothetical protein ACJX0J_039674, partial [Zea mays]
RVGHREHVFVLSLLITTSNCYFQLFVLFFLDIGPKWIHEVYPICICCDIGSLILPFNEVIHVCVILFYFIIKEVGEYILGGLMGQKVGYHGRNEYLDFLGRYLGNLYIL